MKNHDLNNQTSTAPKGTIYAELLRDVREKSEGGKGKGV